jgi:heme/copper-type cytochrome/quinol oxidase subunit 2
VAPQVFTLQPRESRAFDDISNQLFGVPNSLGAVEFSTAATPGGIVVTSRLYSPLAPPATTGSVGMFIPGLPSSSAKAVTVLTNLLNGDFRTNIGVYNPNAVGVTATLRLFDGPVLLGALPVTLGPQTGAQVNDIYGQLKFSTLKTTNGYCTVESSAAGAPLFTYAAEADNTTQDTIFVVGTEDIPAPPGFNPPTPTASATPSVPTATPTPPPVAGTPTPTPTPTAPATIVIGLSATQFQWTFTGDGASDSTFVARVGQTYQLQIRDGDRVGTTAHGFSGIPSLGLPALALTAGGAARTLTFTPNASQLGDAFFSCSESGCGTGHDNMLGIVRVVNP